MFDIGFSELLIIGVVALVVIGPERLPKVARTVGHLLGRMQRYVNDVKSDISREMQLDELRKLQTQVAESARTLESSVRQEVESARSTFSGVNLEAQSLVDEVRTEVESVTEAPVSQAQLTPAPVSSESIAPAPSMGITPPPERGGIDQTTPVA